MFATMTKMQNGKSKFKKIGVWVNILLSLCTIPVALVPFLDPSVFWFVAILGIAFPYLLLLHLLFIAVWALKKNRALLLSLLTIIICIQQILVLFGFHFFANNDLSDKEDDDLRILSWNVARWDESNKDLKGGVTYRALMLDAIRTENADVLCLHEFFEPRTTIYFDKNISVLEQMGYNHYYFYPISITGNGEFMAGMAIFSKFQIIDTGKMDFGITPHSEGVIYADILAKNKRVRVFSVHMESFRMGKDDYTGNVSSEGIVQQTKFYGWSLKKAYRLRTSQSEIVKNAINNSPYPAFVCANLGDLPNSYTYFKVKDGLGDAFLSQGSGLGRTFRYFLPTLRVDYMFYDKRLEIKKYATHNWVYSDHFPQIVDVNLNKIP